MKLQTITRIVGGLVALFVLTSAAFAQNSFEADTQKWRQQREEKLKADDGWLTVSGLFWLKEGINTIGGSPASNIVLPPKSAPAQVGEFEYQDLVDQAQEQILRIDDLFTKSDLPEAPDYSTTKTIYYA